MAELKFNDRELLRLIDREKLSQAAAAKRLGVSRQAVNTRLQQLRGKTTRAVVAKKVEECVDQKLDAMAQLQKINGYANELLDLCMAWGRGDDKALQILESQCQTRKVRVGDEEIDVTEFKFKDPRELALKAMAEIRGQMKLQLEIFQALYDLKAAEEFQQEILQTIGEVSPDVRAKIIHRLNEKRAIRSAVKFTESTVR
ncbi:sigma factor-like helix-turn-helix DNA-binding protein [uncultured Desulfobacter sp.]|uniref:sigma factor-like helix-turn-helix DNA-binding protein n=1 Tax=uncultured Desulfobacter sp. TaxID=240139 RepID=UPI002AAA7946|nr:sigma factor-like helix-turn-helix DNA-binding protein [uncultured Desulfobacter sp.]